MNDAIEYMWGKIRAAGPDADTRAMERQLSLLEDAERIYTLVRGRQIIEEGYVYANYIPIVHTKPFANQEEHDAWYIANGIDPASVKPLPMEHCVENSDGTCMY